MLLWGAILVIGGGWLLALWLLWDLRRQLTTPHFRFNARGAQPRGGIMIEVTCSVGEKFRLQVVPTTASGKPATIEAGSLTVTPVAGAGVNPVATVESNDTFTVQADFPDGSASVDQEFTVSGDADLGSGVQPISDTVLLHVTAEFATNLGLTALGAVPR